MSAMGAVTAAPPARPVGGRGSRRRAMGRRLRQEPALDGLRGLAVAGVVLFHAGYLDGGFLGVDLFFVLSGYLITSILLDEWRREGTLRLGRFWARRARRLLPALVLALLAVAAYAAFVANPFERAGIRGDGLSTLFYVANWHSIVAGQEYWSRSLAPSPLEHAWSLAIEEQFYLLWPPAVLLLLRWRPRLSTVAVAATGLAVASAGLMVVLFQAGASRNSLYLGTHSRVAAIAMGCALGAWHRWRGHTADPGRRLGLEVAALASVAGLGWAWAATDGRAGSFVYLGGLAACGVAGAVVIAEVTHPERRVLFTVLSTPPLRALGLISYGLYLWHWPIFLVLTPERTGLTGLGLFAVRVAASLAVSVASYLLVELPVRRGSLLRGPTAWAAVPAGATVAVVAVVAGTLGAVDPTPAAAGSVGYVTAADPGAVRLMVAGDSIPLLLTQDGIIPERDQLGVSVLDKSIPGCTPMREVGPVQGTEGNIRQDVFPCNDDWGGTLARQRPEVVLFMLGEFPNNRVEIGGELLLPCAPAYQRALEQKLTETVRTLGSQGAAVVLTTVPGSTVSWVVERVPPGMNQRVECVNDVYRSVADQEPGVTIVDLAGYICPSAEECRERIDGVNLREDAIHFRGPAARLVAGWLVPRVLESARQGD